MQKTLEPFVFKSEHISTQSLINRLRLAGYKVTPAVIKLIVLRHPGNNSHTTSYCIINKFNKTILGTSDEKKFRIKALKLLDIYSNFKVKTIELNTNNPRSLYV